MIPQHDTNPDHIVTLGNGPTVAVAHGAGGGVLANFGELADGLDRSLIGPNYPGVAGRPLATEPLELEHLADEVVAAGLSTGAERFPVFGLSLGSAVAVTAAVRHPERVSALVLTVGFARADVQSVAFCRVWQRLAATGAMDELSWHILSGASTPHDLADLDPGAAEAAAAQIADTYPPGGADHVDLVRRADVAGLLPRVAVPTLVVAGGQDRIVLHTTTRAVAEGIAGAELVEYPEAGHIFDPRHTDRWRADIAGFLAKHER